MTPTYDKCIMYISKSDISWSVIRLWILVLPIGIRSSICTTNYSNKEHKEAIKSSRRSLPLSHNTSGTTVSYLKRPHGHHLAPWQFSHASSLIVSVKLSIREIRWKIFHFSVHYSLLSWWQASKALVWGIQSLRKECYSITLGKPLIQCCPLRMKWENISGGKSFLGRIQSMELCYGRYQDGICTSDKQIPALLFFSPFKTWSP